MPEIDFPDVDKNAKIVVAMSGGVDSSTVALLLKKAGYKNIVGMTLILFENDAEKGTVCSDQTIKEDATKVAEKIGIEHHFIDKKDYFYEEVISPFMNGYLTGSTMNPCVTCNRDVKFGVLLEEALKINADYLVTGHYIKWKPSTKGGAICRGNFKRDQSYFLGQVRAEALKHLRFPLANFTKDQVREIAKQNGLHVANKKASNDLCFTGGKSYAKIFEVLDTDTKPGNIIDAKGNILGKHNGIHHFTVGQRKGIGIGGTENPYFVLKINKDTAEVVVGFKEELEVKEVVLTNVNWLGDEQFNFESLDIKSKVRSGQLLVDAVLYPILDNKAKVIFKEPIFGVAKGQICAFYDAEERLLGSGYI